MPSFKHINFFIILFTISLSACSSLTDIKTSTGHLNPNDVKKNSVILQNNVPINDIKEINKHTLSGNQVKSILNQKKNSKFNLTMYKQSINQLLFILARDAQLNLDIHPDVKGEVSINAIQKTIPEILDRLSKQVNFTYDIQKNTLIILPDRPYFKTYRVDYLNLSRDTVSEMNIASQVAPNAMNRNYTSNGTSSSISQSKGGRNNPFAKDMSFDTPQNQSAVNLINATSYRLWDRLTSNIREILSVNNDKIKEINEQNKNDKSLISQQENNTQNNQETLVIPNPEAGLIMIKANASQHKLVENFIKTVIDRSQKQVLIEATLVEVSLNDDYKQGID